ncbi:protein of unknown function [Azospirillum baldaniorum]|uniref:Uncharacterized protein n=1 Tax=Azospirillum baldaniorum TaxID=1064539 RepID=A0A9P1JTP3_9PROT|nr:protein of unknown function [Azospirillum baldaniorum]
MPHRLCHPLRRRLPRSGAPCCSADHNTEIHSQSYTPFFCPGINAAKGRTPGASVPPATPLSPAKGCRPRDISGPERGQGPCLLAKSRPTAYVWSVDFALGLPAPRRPGTGAACAFPR